MPISKTKNYLVLNYNPSPVAVSTKHDSFLIAGGTREEPTTMPFTIDEIAAINSGSPVFKIGLLFFEPEDQEDIYQELRIDKWRDILRDEDIENIILDPTTEGLQKFLDIESDAYFERVRGVFAGLKSIGTDLSTNVEKVINGRYKELSARKRKSEIRLTPITPTTPDSELQNTVKEQAAAMDDMREQMRAMQEMLAKFMSKDAPKVGPEEGVSSNVEDKPKRRNSTKK